MPALELDFTDPYAAIDELRTWLEAREDDPPARAALDRLAVIERTFDDLSPPRAEAWTAFLAARADPMPSADMDRARAALDAMEAATDHVRMKRRQRIEAVVLSCLFSYVVAAFLVIPLRNELPPHVHLLSAIALAGLPIYFVVRPLSRRIVAWME